MKRLVRRAATSLLTRILLVEGITILVACLAMPFAARTVLERSVRTIERDSLRQQADLVASHVTHHADGRWQVDLPREQMAIYASGYDGRAFAVTASDGRMLAHSPYAMPDLWPRDLERGHGQVFATGAVVGLSLPFAAHGTPIRIVVTQDQTRPGAVVDDVVRSFLAHYFLWLVGLLLLMPLANIAMLWPLLRRLRHAAREATQLSPRDPGARFNPAGLPAEAGALVTAINDLLGRVEDALILQQEFAGNVAHELHTPLSTLRLSAERMAPGHERDGALEQIARMAHVLDQLRDLASLEHKGTHAFETLDLTELTIDVVAQLTPSVLSGGRGIAVSGAERKIMIRANRGLLMMAITNLVENARLHTPPGTQIEVTILRAGGVAVADNGPGVTEEQAARLTRRFWRADHKRSDGAGLGLSIVQRIADVHGARLTIRSEPGQGANFMLSLERCLLA
ncbi:MAG: HAMP domain-containing histidine kinase [Sphingomonadales bacterium]|nr:HAMP domain-containing histidine kinase [Sphingomonadales bacterium]MDE2171577.1 HAMP domain-containing histidine kinase [Sphingomonadales bacterium]